MACRLPIRRLQDTRYGRATPPGLEPDERCCHGVPQTVSKGVCATTHCHGMPWTDRIVGTLWALRSLCDAAPAVVAGVAYWKVMLWIGVTS